MKNFATFARIERLSGDPSTATAASLDGGTLHVRTLTTQEIAADWSIPTPSLQIMHGVDKEGSTVVAFAYPNKDQLIGSATTWIIDHYLDKAYIPHEMRQLPYGDRIATGISLPLHTVPVCIGELENMTDYTTVTMAQFVGSAVYVVFNTIQAAGLDQINLVKCGSGEPLPFRS